MLNSRRRVYLQLTATPVKGGEKQSWKFSTDPQIWSDAFLMIRAGRNLTVGCTAVFHTWNGYFYLCW